MDSRHAPFAGHCDFSSQRLHPVTSVYSGLSPSATPRTFRLEERGPLQALTSPVIRSAPTGASTSDPHASTRSEELVAATTDQTRTAPRTACYRRHAHDPGRLRPARSTSSDVKEGREHQRCVDTREHLGHPFASRRRPPVTVMGRSWRLPGFVPAPPKRCRPAAEKMPLPGLCNRLVVNRHPAAPTAPEHRARTRPPRASTSPLPPRACTGFGTTASTLVKASHGFYPGASPTSSNEMAGATSLAVTSIMPTTPKGLPPNWGV